MFPFSNQFQSILNATIDTDDLKNELNFLTKMQQTVSYPTEYYSTVDRNMLIKKAQSNNFVIFQKVTCSGINLTPSLNLFNRMCIDELLHVRMCIDELLHVCYLSSVANGLRWLSICFV
jgi:hypothetical protein